MTRKQFLVGLVLLETIGCSNGQNEAEIQASASACILEINTLGGWLDASGPVPLIHLDLIRTDLLGMTREERKPIEAVCQTDKVPNGTAAYNWCIQDLLRSLFSGPSRPDWSNLIREERNAIKETVKGLKIHKGE